MHYGVAMTSSLFETTGLFCKRALYSFAKEPYKRDYSAEETRNFKEPTNRSHPICCHKQGNKQNIEMYYATASHRCNATMNRATHSSLPC